MDISGDVYATTYFRFSGYAVVTHPPLLRASTSGRAVGATDSDPTLHSMEV